MRRSGAGGSARSHGSTSGLLPVGSRCDGRAERPRAVSEYLVDRMIRGGAIDPAQTSPPVKPEKFGESCAQMVKRYV